jgi:Spy/CpxP family protein refolding chaperone
VRRERSFARLHLSLTHQEAANATQTTGAPMKEQSNQISSHPTPWKFGLSRGFALAAAVAVGMTASYLTMSPSALAASGAPAGNEPSLFARLHGGNHAQAMHAHFDQVLTDAGVNDAQKRQIKAIVTNAMNYQHADMQRYHASIARMKTLLTANGVDVTAVDATRVEQDQLLLATNRRLVDTAVAVAKVLTPAQRQKLGAEIDQMMAAHIGHHQG